MSEAIDRKPKVSLVDVKPTNSAVFNTKSKNISVKDFMKLYTMTIAERQYIGLPYLLTSTDSYTVVTAKEGIAPGVGVGQPLGLLLAITQS